MARLFEILRQERYHLSHEATHLTSSHGADDRPENFGDWLREGEFEGDLLRVVDSSAVALVREDCRATVSHIPVASGSPHEFALVELITNGVLLTNAVSAMDFG